MTSPSTLKANRALYRRKRDLMWMVKATRGCKDCGIKDPIVLEFDHTNPIEKHPALKAKGNNRGSFTQLSLEALYDEMDKCDVVCANCHRRRTAVQQGWAR